MFACIYIYICVCVCVCACLQFISVNVSATACAVKPQAFYRLVTITPLPLRAVEGRVYTHTRTLCERERDTLHKKRHNSHT